MKIHIHTETFTQLSTAASLTRAQTETIKYQSTEGIDKVQCTQTMEYYSTMKGSYWWTWKLLYWTTTTKKPDFKEFILCDCGLRGKISELYLQFIYLFLKILFIYFWREGKGGGEKGRKTPICGCLSHAPHQGPGPQPRCVPWLGIELATLWFAGRHSVHTSHGWIISLV